MFGKRNGPTTRRTSKLSRYILEQNWDKARTRLASLKFSKNRFQRRLTAHSEAACRDHGLNPLEIAFLSDRLPPPDVVEDLIAIFPGAAAYSGPDGRMTLHCLCSKVYDNEDDPATRMRLLRALLDAHPRAATEEESVRNCTPLNLAFERSAMDIAEFEIGALREAESRATTLLTARTERGAFAAALISRPWWGELMAILGAAYFCRKGEVEKGCGRQEDGGESWATDSPFPIVHACAAVRGCPVALIRLALSAYPEQARERDERGYTPLHVVLASHKSSGRGEHTLSHEVWALLQADPHGASVPDAGGRLPLALALEAGVEWSCVRALFLSEPRSLVTRDSKTHIYPFMLSACRGEETEEPNECELVSRRELNIILLLMLANPSVVCMLHK